MQTHMNVATGALGRPVLECGQSPFSNLNQVRRYRMRHRGGFDRWTGDLFQFVLLIFVLETYLYCVLRVVVVPFASDVMYILLRVPEL